MDLEKIRKMNDEEIKEILNKLSNRKQETLLQGLRECQLKNIEHPFITKEEYIDKVLNYIEDLQQENELLKRNCNIGNENLDFYKKEYDRLKNKINKVIEVIDERLIFDDVTSTTLAIGNAKEELQFYLSDCETLDEFRKLYKNNN